MQKASRYHNYFEYKLFIFLSELLALHLGKDICWDLLDYHYRSKLS